jgi:hypothetical protein
LRNHPCLAQTAPCMSGPTTTKFTPSMDLRVVLSGRLQPVTMSGRPPLLALTVPCLWGPMTRKSTPSSTMHILCCSAPQVRTTHRHAATHPQNVQLARQELITLFLVASHLQHVLHVPQERSALSPAGTRPPIARRARQELTTLFLVASHLQHALHVPQERSTLLPAGTRPPIASSVQKALTVYLANLRVRFRLLLPVPTRNRPLLDI